MYIDYLKNDYSNKSEQERQEYIDRDKKHLAGLIQERITNDIEHIVDRWYELDDIGYYSVVKKYLYAIWYGANDSCHRIFLFPKKILFRRFSARV